MHGHNYAITNCVRVMRVMAARAHERVYQCLRKRARMKHTHISWEDIAERARWLILTRISGSVCPIVSLL